MLIDQPAFLALVHVESPSPVKPGFTHAARFQGRDWGSGGLRVLKDSMGRRARSRATLWRSTMCSLMVLALFDTAEPHQQQR